MKNPDFEFFAEQFPEVSDQFRSLHRSVIAQSALDPKTQQLIYISNLAALGYAPAIKSHLPLAIKAGASKDEILAALLTSIPAAGLVPVLPVLKEVAETLDELLTQTKTSVS
ncbi:carboxymuconolactone decarboxylase family protein [Paenibacillus radicis (ex Xue et al. 2023)]|uniref:Carboxymuconolactone decarboxylase family protein n=1 Tax=Paenibacillus radicis (ex Xue et al. 2023) TaxID=2972489 RepID=A0ABT1YM95_9BACL|nr:carboxymuconolactone decarboxylase family protein [Paenibacillus radicis (ex Xue et al. 2023)]MCR8634296.1 carboxymuconolactone decarboxylase family protein [Paenibacillus radicis (ex Xue et al. 2023)]